MVIDYPAAGKSHGRRNVLQEPQEAGLLDGEGEHPLFHGRGAGALAGEDLAVAADHLFQRLGVLIVNEYLARSAGPGDLNLRTAEGLKLLGFFTAVVFHHTGNSLAKRQRGRIVQNALDDARGLDNRAWTTVDKSGIGQWRGADVRYGWSGAR